jgi:hypothetical protein
MIKQAFPVLRVQRYDYFLRYPNFDATFLHFSTFSGKKLGYFK